MPLSKAKNRERMRQVRLHKDPVQPIKTIPIYNPAIHRAGDTVKMWKDRKLVQTIIPELDADGNPIPTY